MRYHTIAVDCRAASWPSRDGSGRSSFHPHGRKTWKHYKPNKQVWSAHGTLSARLFVGFNVGNETKWTVEDLVDIVRRVRNRQVGDPSSSFISQLGIYKHRQGGLVVKEPGAQVIVINLDATPAAFRAQMRELAEEIARQLEQEEVIVEIQRDGRTLITLGINGEPEDKPATPNPAKGNLDRLVRQGLVRIEGTEAVGTAADGSEVVLGFVDDPLEVQLLEAYLEDNPQPQDW